MLLEQPELMPKRERASANRNRSVSYLKLQFRGGSSIFLMAESSVTLPAERHFFMHLLLSKSAFHMRLRGGVGVSIVNLANLTAYTVYSGAAQVPADSLAAEPTTDPLLIDAA